MLLLKNKKAFHQYEIKEKIQAGIVLTGPEVKSLRNKSGSLTGSYVKVLNNELFLLGTQITPYKFADNSNYDPKRTRKLLVKKRQIFHIMTVTDKKGWAAVPLSIELEGKNIKLVIGLGRGKQEFEKREVLKNRALKRAMQKEIKQAHLKF
ncbi:MAG: SsrA-binding protein SmpB [Patescibacteria group bacterium]